MADCMLAILRRNTASSMAVADTVDDAECGVRGSRRRSGARVNAALTGIRSAPATLPPSRISRIRRSSNATASMSSARSDSLQATLYSRPSSHTSSVTELDADGARVVIRALRTVGFLHARLAGAAQSRGDAPLGPWPCPPHSFDGFGQSRKQRIQSLRRFRDPLRQ